jgi:hypothetical protein
MKSRRSLPLSALYYEISDKSGHGVSGFIRPEPGSARPKRGAVRPKHARRSHRWGGPRHARPRVQRARHRATEEARHRIGPAPGSRIAFAAVFLLVTAVLLGLRALADRVPGRAEAGVDQPIAPALTELPAHATGPSRVPWSRAASRTPTAGPSPTPAPHTTAAAKASTRGVVATTDVAASSSAPGVSSLPSGSAAPSGSAGTESVLEIEAEAAGNDRPAPLAVRDVDAASGGRAVTGIGDGRRLAFVGITVAAAGDYRVTIAYLSGEPRWCYIGTGGSSSEVAFPGSGGDDAVATVTVTLTLVAGRNTVEAGNTPGRWCPDLDRIRVAPTDHPSRQRPE